MKQREIKFRAWDIGSEKMINNPSISFLSGWLGENGDKCFDDVNCVFENSNGRLNWMQYTGLKDKLGNEIYEGDIVTYGFKSLKYDNGPFTGKIFFDEYMFLVDGDNENEEWHSINRISDVEVIGNIYQNKEKGTKK